MKRKTKIIIKLTKGFSLVEVMIAMVIFSVGLLGLAGLQSLGMTNNQTAFNRTVAMTQANNMADRMRNNITGVDAGLYDNLTADGTLTLTDCITLSCDTSDLRDFDYYEWNTNNANLLPGGRGSVTRDSAQNQLVICVMWNELNLPSPNIPTCTDGAYNPSNDYKFYALRIEI